MTPEQTKKFKYWQTRTIIVSMIGYALYYFVRKNFNTAMPSIEATFGITKTQLGIFLTLNGVIYGVSRFINGFIADRVSARKFMALGLALCALVNIGFGFSDKMALLITGTAGGSEYITALTIIMGSILLLNGYFQGMGVPPVSPLMTHWVPANELATKMSIWNMSHSIGAGLIFVLGALLVHHFDNSAWRLCFLVPAAISLIGAGALYLTLRDKPSSVGLPELETQAAPPAGGEKKETTSDSPYHKAFLRRMVFGNPIIWVLAVTNFFVYIVRFSMLDWGMMLLPGSKGVSVAVAGIMVAVFEFVGGNLGMVVAGWATDHIFGSRAHRTCVFCMLGAIISTAIFWLVPDTASAWVLAIPFTLIAFFIYGPQALLGIAAANQATKEAAATLVGGQRQRHPGYLRLRQHADLGRGIRLRGRPLRLGQHLHRDPRLRRRRHADDRHDLERQGRRLRSGGEIQRRTGEKNQSASIINTPCNPPKKEKYRFRLCAPI